MISKGPKGRSAFMNFRGFQFSRGEFLMKTFSIFLIGKFIFDGKHKEDEEPKNIGKMATFNQKFTFWNGPKLF